MTRDTSDTTPAGNIFPDFLKRDPITDSSAAIYLECKIKRTSGEKSRLIKLPSKGKDQKTRKKIVYLNQLMMQRQVSLGVECGQSTGQGLICLLQPRISGFHSSYIPSHHQLQTLKAEQSAPIIFCTLAGTVSIEKKLHLKIYPGIMQ